MRLAITGGAGYVGSHVALAALDAGHEVVVIDDLSLSTGDLVPPAARLVRCSIADGEALDRVFSESEFDAVLHFAGSSRVAESVERPDLYFQNNVVGSLTLLDAMRRARLRRIVFSSSAAVYGHPSCIPISEDAPIAPVSPYGDSKAMVEVALERYAARDWISAVSLRYFNAAGADPDGRSGETHSPETHLIPIILHAARTGSSVKIFGDDYDTPDGTCVRDYIHVADLARAHLLALGWLKERTGFRAFNLGTGDGYSVSEIIAAVEQVAGTTIRRERASRRPGDPAILVADPAAAREELGWKPTLSLQQIVEAAYAWHSSPRTMSNESIAETTRE